MAVTAAAAIIGAGVGLYKTLHSASQERKDRARAEALRQPFYNLQDEYQQNQKLAGQIATQGLPVDTKNLLSSEREKGFSTSLDALKRGGGSPNDFARINGLFDDSLKSEASADAQQHLANIQYLIGVNKDIAGQKTTQWGVNEYAPYEAKLKEITQRRAADTLNTWSGISDTVGSLSALGTTLNGNNAGRRGGTGDVIPDFADTSAARADINTGSNFSPASRYDTISDQPSTLI